ncbi:MAG: hypothetical protein O8C67_08855 [Candidatus Methanoperedens sp.]|nr:hypothetical protein [Candidatus Methanoperedens sp.]
MSLIKDDNHVKSVCKPGRLAETCRYLLMGPHGWECGKTDLATKMLIDSRVGCITAKADNCEGK